MQSAQKLVASVQPNFISISEYQNMLKQSIAVQVDDVKKEEMQDIHRELIRANLQALIKDKRKRS